MLGYYSRLTAKCSRIIATIHPKPFIKALALLLCLGLVSERAVAVTRTVTVSTNGGSITWASLWSAGLPGTGDDVTITNGLTNVTATYTVTQVPTTAGTFNSFTMGGTGTGTVTLSATSSVQLATKTLTISSNTIFNNVGVSNLSPSITTNTSNIAVGKTLTITK